MVRLLREAENRTLPLNTLRAAVALSLDCKAADVKESLKDVIDALLLKGRVIVDGKKIVLLKQKKREGSDAPEEKDGDAPPKKKRKDNENGDENKSHAAVQYAPESRVRVVNPSSGHDKKGPVTSKNGAGDDCTRVFLGNLSFKIDEAKLKSAISGITHIMWITDKETGKFYGSAFVELARPRDAAACVGMAGTNILGRPLKANLAPPKPGSTWPPPSGSVAGGRGFGHSVAGPNESPKDDGAKPVGPKPFPECVTLFLANLAWAIDEAALYAFFKDCGEVAKVRWLTHMDTGDFKGCGYIEFWETDAAEKAVLLNGKLLLGRPIRIDWEAGGRN